LVQSRATFAFTFGVLRVAICDLLGTGIGLESSVRRRVEVVGLVGNAVVVRVLVVRRVDVLVLIVRIVILRAGGGDSATVSTL
jgi:hypothetical protein